MPTRGVCLTVKQKTRWNAFDMWGSVPSLEGMNLEQLTAKAREVCPEWLAMEIDYRIEEYRAEVEPLDGDFEPVNFFEELYNMSTMDLAEERRFKLAMTKIERHLGIQKRLSEGEEVVYWCNGRTKILREGDWDTDKCWWELISKGEGES